MGRVCIRVLDNPLPSYNNNNNRERANEEANVCSYSEEAKEIGLREFLERVRDEYFKVCPEDIAWHPESTYKMVKDNFQIHNPRPEHVKRVTQRAQALHQEALDLVRFLA